jgi:hypothetical protein
MPVQSGDESASSEPMRFGRLAWATGIVVSSVSIEVNRTTGPLYKIRAPAVGAPDGSILDGRAPSPGVAASFTVQTAPVVFRLPVAIQLLLVLAVAATAGAGCKREIGDECKTAADCNPNGSRSCDATQPGGYCTIQGCDETSCPEEAACIRYFPAQYLTRACDPDSLTHDCAADEICLEAGLCAPLSTELRYCAKSCSSNDDCRGGYECRLAGTRGSMALTSNPESVVHFCAPITSS